MKEGLIRDKDGLTEKEFLLQYDASIFERPSVTVDMLIFTVMNQEKENYRKLPNKTLNLLMIKRGEHPYLSDWALPGGFVAIDESIDEAASRELKSETNIENIYMEQLYTWGDVYRDPRTRVISSSYMSLIDSSSLELKAGDDAEDAKWFKVDYKIYQDKRTNLEGGFLLERIIHLALISNEERLNATVKVTHTVEGSVRKVSREVIESNGIAFDHAKMIVYAMERLRNKIEYTDIAFNLMPDLFTLSELQQVYEVILDKELLAAAFRRKISKMVIETNQIRKDAGHRPSKLYKYNPLWQENE